VWQPHHLPLPCPLLQVPTILIGCLPTYHHIGIAAPVLMAVLRLVSGLPVSYCASLLHLASCVAAIMILSHMPILMAALAWRALPARKWNSHYCTRRHLCQCCCCLIAVVIAAIMMTPHSSSAVTLQCRQWGWCGCKPSYIGSTSGWMCLRTDAAVHDFM
jgi:hypothetical protein